MDLAPLAVLLTIGITQIGVFVFLVRMHQKFLEEQTKVLSQLMCFQRAGSPYEVSQLMETVTGSSVEEVKAPAIERQYAPEDMPISSYEGIRKQMSTYES